MLTWKNFKGSMKKIRLRKREDFNNKSNFKQTPKT